MCFIPFYVFKHKKEFFFEKVVGKTNERFLSLIIYKKK